MQRQRPSASSAGLCRRRCYEPARARGRSLPDDLLDGRGGLEDDVMTVSLDRFQELAALEHGLCVVNMVRGDGSVVAAVVNAGVMKHPITGAESVAFVARGVRKLAHIRADARVTVVARAGWRWAAVEGAAEIFGPDDSHPAVDPGRLRLLLRDVFTAAGGTHDDWDAYDRTLADERSAAVLVAPARTYPRT